MSLIVVSDLDDESQLALHTKWGKILYVNFINYLEKRDFLQKTLNIGKLYTDGKTIFFTSMNYKSLPQNKAPFNSDSLAKFSIFTRTYVPMIQALSLGTEGITLMRRPIWTCWYLDPLWKVVVCCSSTVVKEQPSACTHESPTASDWATTELGFT